MSDSSEEESAMFFELRDEEDSDDEHPRKRRKTKSLRGGGLGFVKSAAADEQDEDDVDDERPSMRDMSASRASFNIGEYSDPAPTMNASDPQSPRPSPPPVVRPSAFGAGAGANSFAARMMAKMGYQEGKGLGAAGQGIVNPIQAQVTQSRAGLGQGRSQKEEKPKVDRKKIKSGSQASTPRSRTPVPRAPPRKKIQTVADIEARGLVISKAWKTTIIDLSGEEKRTLSSAAGTMTPTHMPSPESDEVRLSRKAKRDLEMFAEAWEAEKENRVRLDEEDKRLRVLHEDNEKQISRLQDVMMALSRTTMNGNSNGETGGAANADFDTAVSRLSKLQTRFPEYISDPAFELHSAAAAILEAPFKHALAEWNPLAIPETTSNRFIAAFQTLSPLFHSLPEIEEDQLLGRRRRHTTPFESLLVLNWFPHVRDSLRRDWDVYDPDPAIDLIAKWRPSIPSWLTAKVLGEIVLPKLISAVITFKPGKKSKAPALHSWLFDWWSMLDEMGYLELDADPSGGAGLKQLVKNKLDSETWPIWKPYLGQTRSRPLASTPPPSTPREPVVQDVEIAFRDVVEEWCLEQDLLLKPTHESTHLGLPVYRLKAPAGKGAGLAVYLRGDVVFANETDKPFGLDDELVDAARFRS